MLNPLQTLAINYIKNEKRLYLIEWWTNKHKRPINDPLLLSLTWDELYYQYILDFYLNNRSAYEEDILKTEGKIVKEWDGKLGEEYENKMKDYWNKKGKVDLSKWQDKKEEEKIENDEFDDNFTNENESIQ